ncbi:MAG: Nif3-like dinuclear metal center hexameric protein [Verrucomicrobiota bacterium]
MAVSLDAIVEFLGETLNHADITDYSGACNGLHLANPGEVEHLFAAVDANVLTVQTAAKKSSSLLIVHHGLAWNGLCPLIGKKYEMIHAAIKANLAIYSSHLPLDAHPVYGNNALLAQLLGFENATPFLEIKGTLLSRLVEVELDRDELTQRLQAALGSAQLIPAGPPKTKRILISSGSGNSLLHECEGMEIDTIVTGEVSHDVFSQAHEAGTNIILGGHYATETLGVKVLTQRLSEKFHLPWEFIDEPSGL